MRRDPGLFHAEPSAEKTGWPSTIVSTTLAWAIGYTTNSAGRRHRHVGKDVSNDRRHSDAASGHDSPLSALGGILDQDRTDRDAPFSVICGTAIETPGTWYESLVRDVLPEHDRLQVLVLLERIPDRLIQGKRAEADRAGRRAAGGGSWPLARSLGNVFVGERLKRS